MEKDFYTTAEIAKLLGITRVAVFKQIKTGSIKAEKIGRNFVIRKENVPDVMRGTLGNEERKDIEQSVKRTVKEYRQTLELLGKE